MVASNSTLVFTVKRSNPELVRPAHPTPIEVKSLSRSDDRQMHRNQLSFILFYEATTSGMKEEDPAKVIKTALSEALVYYYPWAGRLKEASDERLVVDCTAEGVGFVEAHADVRLEDFVEESLKPPFPCIQQLVYYKATNVTGIFGCPMFAMQVTRLLCGGLILTFTFNHVMSDMRGVCQFVTAITDIARGAKIPSVVPIWQREHLDEPPPVMCATAINKFNTMLQASPTNAHHSRGDNEIKAMATSIYRSFFFGPQEIDALRSRIPAGYPCSTFDLIACSVFRSRTISLQPRPEEVARLRFIADARTKLSLPESFYGNACVPASFVCSAGDVCRAGSLGYLVEEMKKAKEEVTEEYARTMWAMKGSPQLPGPLAPDSALSDLSRVGLSNLDFGWGKPVYAGTTDNGLIPHLVSYIISFQNGRLVTLNLPADAMDRFSMALQSLIHGVKPQQG